MRCYTRSQCSSRCSPVTWSNFIARKISRTAACCPSCSRRRCVSISPKRLHCRSPNFVRTRDSMCDWSTPRVRMYAPGLPQHNKVARDSPFAHTCLTFSLRIHPTAPGSINRKQTLETSSGFTIIHQTRIQNVNQWATPALIIWQSISHLESYYEMLLGENNKQKHIIKLENISI
jgi:hypothetical protein